MKYNGKYDVYLDDDFVIYYYKINGKGKFVQRSISKNKNGYFQVHTKIGLKKVHRVIYETFVGEIPEGYEIDHINTNKTDNRLENLQIVTHKENMNNPLTRKHTSEVKNGHVVTEDTKKKISKTKKGIVKSEFGKKFKEHFGITFYESPELYTREHCWYRKHNHKCRWEESK